MLTATFVATLRMALSQYDRIHTSSKGRSTRLPPTRVARKLLTRQRSALLIEQVHRRRVDPEVYGLPLREARHPLDAADQAHAAVSFDRHVGQRLVSQVLHVLDRRPHGAVAELARIHAEGLRSHAGGER